MFSIRVPDLQLKTKMPESSLRFLPYYNSMGLYWSQKFPVSLIVIQYHLAFLYTILNCWWRSHVRNGDFVFLERRRRCIETSESKHRTERTSEWRWRTNGGMPLKNPRTRDLLFYAECQLKCCILLCVFWGFPPTCHVYIEKLDWKGRNVTLNSLVRAV